MIGREIVVSLLFLSHIYAWTLNDLYEQFLQNGRHHPDSLQKRREYIRHNKISKSLSPHHSESNAYEVQTFDVNTAEKRDKSTNVHSLQKHSRVLSPSDRDEEEYIAHKPQVTAWSDWTLGSATILSKKNMPGRPKILGSPVIKNVINGEKDEDDTIAIKHKIDGKPGRSSSIGFPCHESSPSVLCPTASTILLNKNTDDNTFADTVKKVADSEKLVQSEVHTPKDIQDETNVKMLPKHSSAIDAMKLNETSVKDEHNKKPANTNTDSSKLGEGLKAMVDNGHMEIENSNKHEASEPVIQKESAPQNNDTNLGQVQSSPDKSHMEALNIVAQEKAAEQVKHAKSHTSFPAGTVDLPDLQGIINMNFDKQNFKFHDCLLVANSSTCAVTAVLKQIESSSGECNGKISFTALLKQLLPDSNIATSTNDMIVPGKFDTTQFTIDRCTGRVSFALVCRELFDIIPNKLRISKAEVSLNFSFESKPKGMENFNIDIHGYLNLDFRSRRLLVTASKPDKSTLFKIDMSIMDLEIPEFTKLFTETEVSQDSLPPELATLVTSSLRNPEVRGLYESKGGPFEFIASARSPASIFPSQPWVYVIVQKPRLGKCVYGLVASFENALQRSFISSILTQDLSNLPFFKDVNADMAIGISTDGLFVVKDERFNKEVGYLFNAGKTIKKGLTIKVKLPMKKLLEDLENSKIVESFPESVLINIEVKDNKMHIEFPEELRINLSSVPELFAQRGQEINFPKDTSILQDTELKIEKYDIVDITNKVLLVEFSAPQPMKIGSLMVINSVEATLKRDALFKWTFEANGDYQLEKTSVGITLKSKSDGFVISSKPTSIRSSLLVNLLDKDGKLLKPELLKYHLEDFVVENFKIAGSVTEKNLIRFFGEPALFGVEGCRVEFIAVEDSDKLFSLDMGMLCKSVDSDLVFSRMLDRKMLRRSWATGVNVGLIISPLNSASRATIQPATQLQFESEGLSRTKIQPGVHLRVLLTRPDYNMCKGDSLCRILSAEMSPSSAFHFSGGSNGAEIKLGASIKEPLVLSRSLQLTDVSLQVLVKDSIKIFVLASLSLRGVAITFTGYMDVDNTGLLQLKMSSDMTWEEPFGLTKVQFSNCSLNPVFEPGLPLPVFDLTALLQIGDKSKPTTMLEANAVIKISSQDPSKNSFSAKFNKMSLDKLSTAFTTKKPLLKFQQEAVFDGETLLTYEQSNKDDGTPEGDSNSTSFNYKGEMKMTGRMTILGQSAEYTIKFLQKNTQLLTELWLPDIGVNQGLITIRAGLKQQKRTTDNQTPNGPTLLIRMDALTNSAVIVGKVSTLGFSRVGAIKVEDSGYSATIYANLPGNVNTNVSLHSPYRENIQDADFTAAASLPIQSKVKAELFRQLREKASQTKKTLLEAEQRVTSTEKIYETTKAMIDKYKKRSNSYTVDIREKADVIKKLRRGIKRHCVEDCGDSCMGLPSWKRSGISVAGRNAIGAPVWDSCRKKIPDLNCITRCLGRKVIENVKANNKQSELQILMAQLTDTKRSLQDAKNLVDRARILVDATLDDLEKVNTMIKTGVDISKFLNDGKAEEKIDILQVRFRDTLDNAEKGQVNFNIEITDHGENRNLAISAAIDGNSEINIAEAIADKLYPGFFQFDKKIEKVKLILSALDGEKSEITKAVEKTQDENRDKSDDKRTITWTTEEDEFRRLAFGELPRFTLSDDETIHAFEEKSLWKVAPSNNPLYDNAPGDNQIVEKEGEKTRNSFMHELDKQTSCGQLRSSVNKYSGIINPLSEFTESFLQEKIMFYRQKNRRLADLRMIDDQIKSDCFLENCTMEDMDNALSYLSRARDGTLKWANEIDGQIEQQNKVALRYFSQRTADIISVDGGLSLKQYISKVKEVAQNAIRKSDIVSSRRMETDDKIQKLARELHGLLLGVKSGEELSKVAPRIFSMKRQIIALKRNKIPCSEWKNEKPAVAQVSLDRKAPTESILAILSKEIKTPETGNSNERKSINKAPRPTSSMKRSQTSSARVVTENPVLKSRIMHHDMTKKKMNRVTENSGENVFNKKELIQTQENFNQLFFGDSAETNNPVQKKRVEREPTTRRSNPFSYWNNYGAW